MKPHALYLYSGGGRGGSGPSDSALLCPISFLSAFVSTVDAVYALQHEENRRKTNTHNGVGVVSAGSGQRMTNRLV